MTMVHLLLFSCRKHSECFHSCYATLSQRNFIRSAITWLPEHC